MSAFQDSLVYVLNRERHTVGQRTPSSKPSISLSAPDILPLHCTIRRRRPLGRAQPGAQLVLEPIPGASVSVNFSEVGGRAVVLRHGDLLSLGLYYLLLLKDPAQAQPLPAQALARLRAVPESCRMCGAPLRARGASVSARPGPPRARPLHLEFEPDMEDALLQRIMTLVEPGGNDHKLTPAFLLCLCIQHSATRLEPGSFGQLLLKMAKMIRETVWVSGGAGGGSLPAASAGRGAGGSCGRLGGGRELPLDRDQLSSLSGEQDRQGHQGSWGIRRGFGFVSSGPASLLTAQPCWRPGGLGAPRFLAGAG